MYIHFNRWCPARPASWLLDNGRLNLVLLGAELLASGLQAQVHHGGDNDGDLVDDTGAELPVSDLQAQAHHGGDDDGDGELVDANVD